jgi:FG-GAP repeat
LTGKLIKNFFAFAPTFLGGSTIAAADFTGDGKVDLVVGAGAGGGPHVRVFDLQTEKTIPNAIGNFYAFDTTFTGGVDVGTDWKASDVTGDGYHDLVVGAGPGGGPHVKVFDGKTGGLVSSFFAFDSTVTNGVRVGTAFVSDDKYADVVVGTGPGTTAQIKVFDGQTMKVLPQPLGAYTPFGTNFTGGLSIAASNDPPAVDGYAKMLATLEGGEFLYSPLSWEDLDDQNKPYKRRLEDNYDIFDKPPVIKGTPFEKETKGKLGQDYGVRIDGALELLR